MVLQNAAHADDFPKVTNSEKIKLLGRRLRRMLLFCLLYRKVFKLKCSPADFKDNVQMLTSLEVGHGGVWLMCPSQLLFVPDVDFDDKPDSEAIVVLDGFEVPNARWSFGQPRL